jgi:hypothetical protein
MLPFGRKDALAGHQVRGRIRIVILHLYASCMLRSMNRTAMLIDRQAEGQKSIYCSLTSRPTLKKKIAVITGKPSASNSLE